LTRIMITGALGHIGSRFIRSIAPEDYDNVVLLDNLSSQRYCSLFNLRKDIPFQFIEDDICTADLEKYMKDINVVLHLAAVTDAAGSIHIKDQVWRVNVEGTERVARACIARNCRLLFPSSTSVYGTQKELVDESCNAEDLKPQSPYAASKLQAEFMLRRLGESDSLRFTVFRAGTIFGTSPGMRFHTAVNKFCWQAVMGQPLTVWRSAYHQVRPYLDLGDAVAAMKFVIRKDLFNGETYNVLTVNATVEDIVEAIAQNVPDVSIQFVDTAIMNQLSYHVLNDKFKSLGFESKGDLERGIKDTIQLLGHGRTSGERTKSKLGG